MVAERVPVAASLMGHPRPRIAPPLPARSDVKAFRETASSMGIALMPWQETAGRYLTARGPEKRLLYREVAIVVARQNGKTTLMKPYIIGALRTGKRVMHIAQTRELPRHMFGVIADALSAEPELFPKRRGKVIWPRYGAGQEEIVLQNGGTYRIAAARTGGARGWTNDLVIIDELREMDSFDIINAAEPTLTMSPDPQMVYLSNEGDENAVVLNAVRERSGQDESLAYLEWSASPDREPDDREGWAESNPALGHYPSVLRTLEAAYRRHSLAGTMPIFETEHLCRRVPTLSPALVEDTAWAKGEHPNLEPTPKRASLGVAMDPSGRRASAAVAWPRADGTFGLRVLFDVTGEPIDTDRLGRDMRERARQLVIIGVGFDPATDTHLSKFFPRSEPITAQKAANASARFVSLVEAGKVKWEDALAVGMDLGWTTRRENDETGSFQAVRSSEERPITAALAAIRALWLASAPKADASGKPRPAAVGF